MALFRTDSITLIYSNVEAAKQWWINTFACKERAVPRDWDNPLPSDIALSLPGDSERTILLSHKAEVSAAGFERLNPVASVILSDKLKKAHDHVTARGILAGPIEDGGDTQFFEVRDPEGNVIEVCKEP